MTIGWENEHKDDRSIRSAKNAILINLRKMKVT